MALSKSETKLVSCFTLKASYSLTASSVATILDIFPLYEKKINLNYFISLRTKIFH